VATPDLSRLSVGDAEVALRSYVRRYGAELRAVEGDDRADEIANRFGPGGESALDVVSDVTRTIGLLDHELHEVLTRDDPVLHPATADERQRRWDTPGSETIDEALTFLGHEIDQLLSTMSMVDTGDDWSRSGTAAGGGRLSALDLVKEAVRVGADGIDRVARILTAVRDRR
jgi:hypothetical protein